MRFIFRIAIISVFCAVAADARSPINLDILRRDGYGVVPLQRARGNDLLVRATINGRAASLLLDSGWGSEGITLHTNYAGKLITEETKDYTLSAFGARMSVRKGPSGLITLGNAHIKDVPLFVGTFDQTLGANGFLGAGFLRTNSAIIDVPDFRLYLRPPRTGRMASLGAALKAKGFSEVSFTGRTHGVFLVSVEINGLHGKMVLDTGASLTGVDKRFAARLKAKGYDMGLVGTDAAGITSGHPVANLGRFKIGGVPAHAPEVTLNTFPFYSASDGTIIGLLGMDVLGKNWSIIDFGQQKLYFSPIR